MSGYSGTIIKTVPGVEPGWGMDGREPLVGAAS